MNAAAPTFDVPAQYMEPSSFSSGYKQSDVGLVPKDWAVFSVGELFDYQRTASNSRSDLGDTGTVSYVHYGDLHIRFDHFIDFERDKLPQLLFPEGIKAIRLRNGDLIVADASEDQAGVGKSVEVRNLGAIDAVSGLHTFLLRAKDNRTLDGYRGYLLENRVAKEQLRRLATGLKVFGISKRALGSIRIPLPPLAEQRAISQALSDVDGLLGSLDAVIAKKRAVKQATMQQLLTGKTRLPGFRGEWKMNRLDEIASVRDQKVLPSHMSPDTLCIELDHIGQENGRLAGHSTAEFSTSSKYRFFAGDVLFGRLRSYLRKYWHADRNGICTTEIWPLMADPEQMDSGFLHILVQTERFMEAASVSYGTHMPRAEWSVVRGLEFSLPPLGEQRSIARFHSDMDAEIDALERRRDKARAIKEGMMQQLLTGRMRLATTE